MLSKWDLTIYITASLTWLATLIFYPTSEPIELLLMATPYILLTLYSYYAEKEFIQYVGVERYRVEGELPYFIGFIKILSRKTGLEKAVEKALESRLFPTLSKLGRGVTDIKEFSDVIGKAGYPNVSYSLSKLYLGEEVVNEVNKKYDEILGLYSLFKNKLKSIAFNIALLTVLIPIILSIQPILNWMDMEPLLAKASLYFTCYIISSTILYIHLTLKYRPYTPLSYSLRFRDYLESAPEHVKQIIILVIGSALSIYLMIFYPLLTPLALAVLIYLYIRLFTNIAYLEPSRYSRLIYASEAGDIDTGVRETLKAYAGDPYILQRLREAIVSIRTGRVETRDTMVNHILSMALYSGDREATSRYLGYIQNLVNHMVSRVGVDGVPASYVAMLLLYPVIQGLGYAIISVVGFFIATLDILGSFNIVVKDFMNESTYETLDNWLYTIEASLARVAESLATMAPSISDPLLLLYSIAPFKVFYGLPRLRLGLTVVLGLAATLTIYFLSSIHGFIT